MLFWGNYAVSVNFLTVYGRTTIHIVYLSTSIKKENIFYQILSLAIKARGGFASSVS